MKISTSEMAIFKSKHTTQLKLMSSNKSYEVINYSRGARQVTMTLNTFIALYLTVLN